MTARSPPSSASHTRRCISPLSHLRRLHPPRRRSRRLRRRPRHRLLRRTPSGQSPRNDQADASVVSTQKLYVQKAAARLPFVLHFARCRLTAALPRCRLMVVGMSAVRRSPDNRQLITDNARIRATLSVVGWSALRAYGLKGSRGGAAARGKKFFSLPSASPLLRASA